MIAAGRVGARIVPDDGPLSFHAGIGGGVAIHGLGTADAGLSFGWQNCYVVPVATVSAIASIGSSSQDRFGIAARAGARVALAPWRCRVGSQVPWLSVGADVTNGMLGVGAGLTIPL